MWNVRTLFVILALALLSGPLFALSSSQQFTEETKSKSTNSESLIENLQAKSQMLLESLQNTKAQSQANEQQLIVLSSELVKLKADNLRLQAESTELSESLNLSLQTSQTLQTSLDTMRSNNIRNVLISAGSGIVGGFIIGLIVAH